MANRNISRRILDKEIERQNHNCAYCLLPFGSVVTMNRGEVIQNPVADHFVPFAYGGVHTQRNAIAACQICNNIKRDMIFDSVESASRYVLGVRHDSKKKYVTRFIPVTPSSKDPVAWVTEYNAYCWGGDMAA